jgi:hypothetical protein
MMSCLYIVGPQPSTYSVFGLEIFEVILEGCIFSRCNSRNGRACTGRPNEIRVREIARMACFAKPVAVN